MPTTRCSRRGEGRSPSASWARPPNFRSAGECRWRDLQPDVLDTLSRDPHAHRAFPSTRARPTAAQSAASASCTASACSAPCSECIGTIRTGRADRCRSRASHGPESDARQVLLGVRAEHDDPRVVILTGGQDGAGDVPEVGLPDLTLSRYSRGSQLRDDICDQPLALGSGAIELHAAEPADREFMHVQDYDSVAGLACEIFDHLDGSGHVPARLVARRVDGKQHCCGHFASSHQLNSDVNADPACATGTKVR